MNHLEKINRKIVSLDQLLPLIQQLKTEEKRCVFTNGCFDILHRGHLTYLSKAADLGDFLVVGVNTDASVKRQGKGDDRPINDESARMLLLAGLSVVDFVVLFDDDTPLKLIEKICPNVLVKGGDYDENESDKASKKFIVGSDIVKNKGGIVKTIAFVDGFSTTQTINKIKKQL